MTYWHLYGGWLPKNKNYRGTVVHTVVNETERPELTFEDALFQDGRKVPLQLFATFDHEPSNREQRAALPQLFQGLIDDDDEDVG